MAQSLKQIAAARRTLSFAELRDRAEQGIAQRAADARMAQMIAERPLQIAIAERELARRVITPAEYFELEFKTIRKRNQH